MESTEITTHVLNFSKENSSGTGTCLNGRLNGGHPKYDNDVLKTPRPRGLRQTAFNLVLTGLTLALFWVDPCCPERLIVGTLIILMHCLYLTFLARKLPETGNSSPLIVLFFRDSIAITGFGIIITIMLRFITKSNLDPPQCINSIYEWLLRSSIGQYLVLGNTDPKAAAEALSGDENSTLVTATTKRSGDEWIMVAVFFDRLCFLIYFVVFGILLAAVF